MKSEFGVTILAGFLMGCLIGSSLGAAQGHPILGGAIGALGGVFLGWFIAAIVIERRNTPPGK